MLPPIYITITITTINQTVIISCNLSSCLLTGLIIFWNFKLLHNAILKTQRTSVSETLLLQSKIHRTLQFINLTLIAVSIKFKIN
jgi:hypothetical protein